MGDGAQRCHVEGPVMCRSVLADQSGTVQTEYHVQLEDGNVVNDIVEGTLRERAVDVTKRLQPLFGHTS